jgi:tetraprenyl-beta-curcumene synthase
MVSANGVACFLRAGWGYWTSVYPLTCAELERWRRAADAIPDPPLRDLALLSLRKRGNIEGAAAFAAFVPARRRPTVVRACVAFQTAYNYLDVLSEQPSASPGAQARTLHRALVAAVTLRGAPHEDHYADSLWAGDDGGYLARLVQACSQAFGSLPSAAATSATVTEAAGRIVEFQAHLGGDTQDGSSLPGWGAAVTPSGCGLRWWESAAAAGSSLGIYALIAAAATPGFSRADARRLERAYFPWIGALNSLLDSVVDVAEDAASGQHSLFAGYAARSEAKARMGAIARRSRQEALALPHGMRHLVVIAGMCGMYLSAPEASREAVREVRREVLAEVGPLAKLALLVFATRDTLAKPHGPGTASSPAAGEAARAL